MMTYRRWTIVTMLAALLLLAGVAVVHYVADPFGIYTKDHRHSVADINIHYVKVRFLEEHPDAYDSFVFGSSRMNVVDPSWLRDGSWYNLWYSEGLPAEHLRNIRYLVGKGVKVRNMLVAIDDFCWKVRPEAHHSQLLRQPYPPTVGGSFFSFHLTHLLRRLDWKMLRKALKGRLDILLGRDTQRYSQYGSILDRGYMPAMVLKKDAEIAKDPDTHLRKFKSLKANHYDGDYMDGALEDIRGLVELSREHGINLVLCINPIHHLTYLDAGVASFDRFKHRLAGITSFYDFSGLNSVTTDDLNYFETSHFRPHVAKMMLARMFGHPDITVPADFGRFVPRRTGGGAS